MVLYVSSTTRHSSLVIIILEKLDFHALPAALLATVAHHSKWDTNWLAGEWDKCRTDMLQTEPNKSLTATIKFSILSLMFQKLGPITHDLPSYFP